MFIPPLILKANESSEISERSVVSSSGQHILNHIGEKYLRHSVLDDGDCGYTAFGITRNEAYERINVQLTDDVINLLRPAIQEVIIRQEFFDYLQRHHIIEPATQLAAIEANLEQYVNDRAIIAAYLDYDIRDRMVDAGWAHPAVLQALAHIQRVEIRIWQINSDNQLTPHEVAPFEHYAPPAATQQLDLLFVNGNHFERLELADIKNKGIHKLAEVKNEGIHKTIGLIQAAAYAKISEYLDYNFKNINLLTQALTRKSACLGGIQEEGIGHNETLSTLGDSILRTCIDDVLIEIEPKITCDKLSFLRDQLVSNKRITEIAEKINFSDYLIMGRGEHINLRSGGDARILPACLEAIIGALFLDSGRDYITAKKFIIKHWNFQKYYNKFLLVAIKAGKPQQVEIFLKLGADPNARAGITIHSYRAAYCPEQPQDIGDIMLFTCKISDASALEIAIYHKILTKENLIEPRPSSPERQIISMFDRIYVPRFFHLVQTKPHLDGRLEKTTLIEFNNRVLAANFEVELGHAPAQQALSSLFKSEISEEQRAILTLLLQHGANPNQKSQSWDESTPLHAATSYGNVEVVKLLLEWGADKAIVNKVGHSPFDYASAKVKALAETNETVETKQIGDKFMLTHSEYLNICAQLGYEFNERDLLTRALTRKSACEEKIAGADKGHNEILSYLGDSILRTCIINIFFETDPDVTPDDLSKDRDLFGNRKLAKVAADINLYDYLIMGKGERRTLYNSTKILARSLKALLGALFLDSHYNYQTIKEFILKHWDFEVDHTHSSPQRNLARARAEPISADIDAILSARLGYQFQDKKLLNQALSRQTAIKEKIINPAIGHNEALSTLGDSVLRTCIGDILIETNPEMAPDELSPECDRLVRNDKLAHIAENINFCEFLYMGRGERRSYSQSQGCKNEISAACLEALIGAIFLDSNQDHTLCKKFIIKHWNLDEKYQALLFTAIQENDAAKVCLYLKLGIDPNLVCPFQKGQNTALHNAARLNNENIVKLLLEHGANKNIRNSAGNLPYDCASTARLKSCLKLENAYHFNEGSSSSSQYPSPSRFFHNTTTSSYRSDNGKDDKTFMMLGIAATAAALLAGVAIASSARNSNEEPSNSSSDSEARARAPRARNRCCCSIQ